MSRIKIFDVRTTELMDLFNKMVEEADEDVSDYTELEGGFYLQIRDTLANVKYNEAEIMYHGLDINVSVAASITAYGRVLMSLFKNNSNFNLYYSDTDSAIIDRSLPEQLVGNELGQLKLEYEIGNAVFIAPKVYGFVTTNGETVIKVKGLSPANYED